MSTIFQRNECFVYGTIPEIFGILNLQEFKDFVEKTTPIL